MTQEKTLLNELRLVHIAMRRGMSTHEEFHKDRKLPTGSSMILHYLFHEGGSALQKDVENEFHLRRSTVSQQLRRLEEDGYITRETAQEDGRSKRILLSEKAKAEQSEIVQKFRDVESYMEAALTDREKETFFELCEKIRARLSPVETK